MTSPTSPVTFAPLGDAIGQELLWQNTKVFKRNYELRLGETLYATLVWQRSWRGVAELTTANGRWTFQRRGFWRPRIVVTDSASGAESATFARKWSGGALIFDPGRVYTFRRQGAFNPEWRWLTPQGATAMGLRARGFGGKARVVVEPSGADAPVASILAGLGWYLLILMNDEAVAASTAATTAATTAAV